MQCQMQTKTLTIFVSAKRDNCMDERKCFCWHSANNVYIIASTKWREHARDRINLNVCQFAYDREYSANFTVFRYASVIHVVAALSLSLVHSLPFSLFTKARPQPSTPINMSTLRLVHYLWQLF